ncbi:MULTISPECIES: hypothetical protein [unclassified Nocardioides]|uniref:hypothetical protein n=1 Tax=unclassified Nocardioides TaxID=2615069 RepID=UPI000A6437A6|nr:MULTISPECIES: hypothetical protein [unclassified Nocardioides]
MNEEKIDELIAAIKVTNALLLAQAMGLDITEPMDAAKVMRYLPGVVNQVGRGTRE